VNKRFSFPVNILFRQRRKIHATGFVNVLSYFIATGIPPISRGHVVPVYRFNRAKNGPATYIGVSMGAAPFF
jgi:hypothetical protein